MATSDQERKKKNVNFLNKFKGFANAILIYANS